MTGYRFQAHSTDGKRFSGVIQADTAEEARERLGRQRLIVDSLKREPRERTLRLSRTPSPRAMVQFSRQFATLIESGVPLLLALEILQGLTDDGPLLDALSKITQNVAEGGTLAGAMRRQPKVFDPIFVNVVEAGEEGGSLDVSLNRMADYLERSGQVRDRVRGAMMYPLVIAIVAVASVIALLTLVVPTFDGMFASSGLELPFATQILVSASDFAGSNLPFIVVGLLVTILGAKTLYGTDWGRAMSHRVLLRTPVAGRIGTKVAVARTSRTLASLIASGVPILDAITGGSRTAGLAPIEDALMRSRGDIAMGSTVTEALAKHEVLPPLVARMVGVGEQTGKLAEMFAKVADFYEREVDSEIEGMLKALEPALVVVVGVVLGGIVVAMYLPIFDAVGAAGI